jgi:hypothetical protein
MKVLDLTGLARYTNKLNQFFATKEELSNLNIEIEPDRMIEYIVGTQTNQTNNFTGVSVDNSLYDGKAINYYLPYNGTSNGCTLDLTLADNTTTGAKTIYIYGTTQLTTQYAGEQIISMVYSALDDCWYCGNYWANANVCDTYIIRNGFKAASAITNRYFIVGDINGYKNLAYGVTFDIRYPIVWANEATTAGKLIKTAYLSYTNITLNNKGFSWPSGGVIGQMCYVQGTLSGTSFTVDSTYPVVFTEPTSENGKFYIPIGALVSDKAIVFKQYPGIYYYKDGAMRPYGYYNTPIPSNMTSSQSQDNTDTTAYTISPKVLNDLIDAKIADIPNANNMQF